MCGATLDSENYVLSEDELIAAYKDLCNSYSYEEVARNPDQYEGKLAVFTGEVIQVLEDGGNYTLRVNVTRGGYGFWDDTILVYYEAKEGESRILEDDVLTFYGIMGGMYSYESIFGATITVPLMEAVYIEF